MENTVQTDPMKKGALWLVEIEGRLWGLQGCHSKGLSLHFLAVFFSRLASFSSFHDKKYLPRALSIRSPMVQIYKQGYLKCEPKARTWASKGHGHPTPTTAIRKMGFIDLLDLTHLLLQVLEMESVSLRSNGLRIERSVFPKEISAIAAKCRGHDVVWP